MHQVWVALHQAAQLRRDHVVRGRESIQAQVEVLQSLVEHEGIDNLFRNLAAQLALGHAQVFQGLCGLEELGERFDGVEVERVRIQVQIEQVFAQGESIRQEAYRDRLLDLGHDQLLQAVRVLFERQFEGFDKLSAHLDACEVYVSQVRLVTQRTSNQHGCRCIIQVTVLHHKFGELLNVWQDVCDWLRLLEIDTIVFKFKDALLATVMLENVDGCRFKLSAQSLVDHLRGLLGNFRSRLLHFADFGFNFRE